MTARQETNEVLVEEIDDELADKWEGMIEEAERGIQEVRVSFLWLQPQVAVIKRAAALLGIPYQTYMKQAAFRQAVADWRAAEVTVQPANGKG